MELKFHYFINIILAAAALIFYFIGSRRFYMKKRQFLTFLAVAVGLDAITAVLASFGVTPTRVIPGSDFAPWRSPLFLAHVILATIGFFGFIALVFVVLIKGKELLYPRLRKMQYKILLPMWLVGETIALINALVKIIFGFRLYDFI
jgi:hypothetical protein